MSTDISAQLRSLTVSLAAGVFLGLLYDALRPPRRGLGGAASVMLDGAFCCVAGGVLFCLAMSGSSGRLGTWELAAAVTGFLVYMHTLSSYVLRIFCGFWLEAEIRLKSMKIILKKYTESIKIFFQNRIKCIIIKMKRPSSDSAEAE